jgi:hypothetical protein
MLSSLKEDNTRLAFTVSAEKAPRSLKDASKREIYGCEMLAPEDPVISVKGLPWLVHTRNDLVSKLKALGGSKEFKTKDCDLYL